MLLNRNCNVKESQSCMIVTLHHQVWYIDHLYRQQLIIVLKWHFITNWYLVCISKTTWINKKCYRLTKFLRYIQAESKNTKPYNLHWTKMVSNTFSGVNQMVCWNMYCVIHSSCDYHVHASESVSFLQKCSNFTVC